MRGYFAFLVVFVSVFLLISLSQGFSYSDFDKSTDIAINHNYQAQLNLKHSILEEADQSAKKALLEYMLLHLGEPVDLNDMKNFVRERTFEGIKKIDVDADNVYDAGQYDVVLWCGYTNDKELDSLKKQMFTEKKALICDECVLIGSDECKKFVNLDVNAENGEFSYLWLGANKPLDFFKKGVVGVSIYDKKFDVSGAGYTPQGEKRSLT